MTLLVACGLKREAAIIERAGLIVVAGGGDAARLERELEAAVVGATGVLSCGIAGALDPRLKAGDVVIGELYGLFPGEGQGGGLLDWLGNNLPQAHRGTIIGADRIIASAAEKAALHATTGAIAVDMESHIAARVAARHGLPFAILRTISDTADHALPPAALVGMKPDGSMALGAVLASLARHPSQLPALIRTGRDAGAAFAALMSVWHALGAQIYDVPAERSDQFFVGDRLEVSGGYDYDPRWLSDRHAVLGTVISIIPGQNKEVAVVVNLDQPLSISPITGSIVVLELRNAGATWTASGTVHVELCDFQPEPKRWQDRRQGQWVESHASYRRLP